MVSLAPEFITLPTQPHDALSRVFVFFFGGGFWGLGFRAQRRRGDRLLQGLLQGNTLRDPRAQAWDTLNPKP